MNEKAKENIRYVLEALKRDRIRRALKNEQTIDSSIDPITDVDKNNIDSDKIG